MDYVSVYGIIDTHPGPFKGNDSIFSTRLITVNNEAFIGYTFVDIGVRPGRQKYRDQNESQCCIIEQAWVLRADMRMIIKQH